MWRSAEEPFVGINILSTAIESRLICQWRQNLQILRRSSVGSSEIVNVGDDSIQGMM